MWLHQFNHGSAKPSHLAKRRSMQMKWNIITLYIIILLTFYFVAWMMLCFSFGYWCGRLAQHTIKNIFVLKKIHIMINFNLMLSILLLESWCTFQQQCLPDWFHCIFFWLTMESPYDYVCRWESEESSYRQRKVVNMLKYTETSRLSVIIILLLDDYGFLVGLHINNIPANFVVLQYCINHLLVWRFLLCF